METLSKNPSVLTNEDLEELLASSKYWNEEELQLIEDLVESEPVEAIPLLDFGLKYFKHHFTHAMPEFHEELVGDLQALPDGESICRIAPRGSAKSTWTTLIYPIWKTVYQKKKYIILLGDTQPNANLFLQHISDEFEHNLELQADFPSCMPALPWRAEAIELSNGTRIEALCYGKGKIRGRRHRHYRPDLIIIDDPQNSEDATSPALLEKDEEWLKSDVLNAGGPETNYIMVGTALVDGCLVLQVKKTLPTWSHKVYKSLISEPTNMHLWQQWKELLWRHDDPQKIEKAEQWYLQHQSGEGGMDYGAKVLWPDRVPLYELMLKRFSQGERAFASEHQGDPMPPSNAEFNISYFEYDDTFWFDEWPVDTTIRVMGCDPSKGIDTKEGDYQAIVRWAEDRNEVVYVEAFLKKMDTKIWCDYLVYLQSEWTAHAIGLEVNGFQQLLEFPLAESAKAKSIHMRLPIIPLENRIKKAVRILDLTDLLVTRRIKFKRNSEGTALLIDQLKKFRIVPAPGQHDDGPDALAMARETAYRYVNKK